jgi:beta-phosphoglucomutase
MISKLIYDYDPRNRVLILDFDGVLVDTEPVNFAAWNHAFDEVLGIRLEGDYTQLVGLTLDEIYYLWASTRPGTLELLTDDLKQQLLQRKTAHFFNIGTGKLTPMPGSIDLIKRAQNHFWYVAVASRSKSLRLNRTLYMLNMLNLFDVVMSTEDVVDAVTDRKIHSRGADFFKIDPAACVVVEDSASGVADAVACGIGHVIGFAHALDRTTLLASGAHQVVENLSEINLNDY